jgi:VanZ family protein
MLGIIIFSGILLACGIEILQGMTEYRSMEIFDLAADLLGLFASSFLILCASAIYNKW